MLLARRDHTLHIEVLVDDSPDVDNPEYVPQTTDLRDNEVWSHAIPSEELLAYDAENDFLVLRAGVILTPRAMEGEV
jgi:hypothetical protein